MIIVLKPDVSQSDLEQLVRRLHDAGCTFRLHHNDDDTILHILSGQNHISKDLLMSQPGVHDVFRMTPPYILAARKHPEETTVIGVGETVLHPDQFTIIAGPCAVESETQMIDMARKLSGFGIRFMRGGAFKPRTSPYAFQGLGEEGLQILRRAADQFAMKVVTEAVSSSDVPLVAEYADVIQIGTRNMQNYRLLKVVGRQNRPVLLKRGMNATIDEFLLAAEYILQEGNHQIILCERGIRTFESATRNTLDISAVPLVKYMSHLPIFVDPSHASGKRSLIQPLSLAAMAAGADGLLVEVHNQVDLARSDGPQSITFDELEKLLEALKAMAPLMSKRIV